jgi:hypothetical protein
MEIRKISFSSGCILNLSKFFMIESMSPKGMGNEITEG